ncbi:hypothetical protein SKAU_G00298960 [Synaphobranchus kaupii]|uniref:Uncharacterized protein n=1 Tax=Synaphobranchus kaupii TaxID=118154 RepID=A0A9Q1IN29_SYNKA|nr:hypothetical protein SKAU_G00298960 [Synaphobranchus kaupii]
MLCGGLVAGPGLGFGALYRGGYDRSSLTIPPHRRLKTGPFITGHARALTPGAPLTLRLKTRTRHQGPTSSTLSHAKMCCRELASGALPRGVGGYRPSAVTLTYEPTTPGPAHVEHKARGQEGLSLSNVSRVRAERTLLEFLRCKIGAFKACCPTKPIVGRSGGELVGGNARPAWISGLLWSAELNLWGIFIVAPNRSQRLAPCSSTIKARSRGNSPERKLEVLGMAVRLTVRPNKAREPPPIREARRWRSAESYDPKNDIPRLSHA